MKGRILCSTGAFSRHPDRTNPEEIARHMRLIDCDGFELIFYPSFYDDVDLCLHHLRPTSELLQSLHTEKSIGPLLGDTDRDKTALGLQRLEINAQLAHKLSIQRLVLHLWGLPESDRHIERNLAQIDACVRIAGRYDCHLSIESIPCLQDSPLAHLETIAADYPDVRFTLDTEFLHMHNQLQSGLESPEVFARAEQIHIKDAGEALTDRNGRRIYLHPGEGSIDFDRVADHTISADHIIDWCLESSSVNADGSINGTQLQNDLEFMTDILSRAERRHDQHQLLREE